MVFRVDQIISGVAVNLLAAGAVRVLSSKAFEGEAGGGLARIAPRPGGVGHFTAPFLSGGGLFGWDTPDILGGSNAVSSFRCPTAPGCSGG